MKRNRRSSKSLTLIQGRYGYYDLTDERDQYKRNVPELSYPLDTLIIGYSRRISL